MDAFLFRRSLLAQAVTRRTRTGPQLRPIAMSSCGGRNLCAVGCRAQVLTVRERRSMSEAAVQRARRQHARMLVRAHYAAVLEPIIVNSDDGISFRSAACGKACPSSAWRAPRARMGHAPPDDLGTARFTSIAGGSRPAPASSSCPIVLGFISLATVARFSTRGRTIDACLSSRIRRPERCLAAPPRAMRRGGSGVDLTRQCGELAWRRAAESGSGKR